MAIQSKVSLPVIKRLPKYYRYLTTLSADGKEKISSSELAHMMGTTASQVRQDFNCFGGFGQQGYGYNIKRLRDEIAHILGLDGTYRVAIVGAGNIGRALISYCGFACKDFQITGIFDVRQELIGQKVNGCEIRHVDTLEAFIKENKIDLGIICTPKQAAQSTAALLCRLGIRGIWNFAPVDVAVTGNVQVENVHLSDSLYVLLYHMGQNL